jgi:hypothetical protein
MATDLSPLAVVPVRASIDPLSVLLVVLVTSIIHALPVIAQALGVVVLAITFWEKPTVQALWKRLRIHFNRKDDDAVD